MKPLQSGCLIADISGWRRPDNRFSRSCEVVPPFEEAMHTTAATDRAISRCEESVQPRTKNIRHVKSNVATVMPEMGFEDDPISPVNLDDTVTNRNPNNTMSTAAIKIRPIKQCRPGETSAGLGIHSQKSPNGRNQQY